MKNTFARALPCLSLAVAIVAATHSGSVVAAALSSVGHAAGAQCGASDVNDSGVVVGSCKPGNSNGSLVAWVSTAGTEISLPALATGKGCEAGGITNSGSVVGSCTDASGVAFAVRWNSASPATPPVKLAPLPGLLGLGADVSTFAGAFNQSGVVAGQSVDGSGRSTAVVWPAGSGTPVRVSSAGDNCAVVDVADSAVGTNPAILLNCPSGTGTVKPMVATLTGVLGTYATAALTKSASSTYCFATAINSALQILGTCVLPVAPFSRLAFWASPTATPRVLNLPNFTGDTVGKRNGGKFLNSLGHVVYGYQMSDGRRGDGFGDAASNIFIGNAIPPIHAGSTVTATGLGDNDLVVVVGENSSENTQAAIFNPASPAVVTPVPFFGGGAYAVLGAVSKNGTYAVGMAEDSNHDANAVVTTLP